MQNAIYIYIYIRQRPPNRRDAATDTTPRRGATTCGGLHAPANVAIIGPWELFRFSGDLYFVCTYVCFAGCRLTRYSVPRGAPPRPPNTGGRTIS